jgi:phage tail sheath protein FI
VDDVAQLTQAATVGAEAAAATPAAGGRAGAAAAAATPSRRTPLRARDSERGYGALYFPWLRVRDAIDPEKIVSVPPSGHVAGICARTDVQRGVHKAPANVAVRGALGVTYNVSKAEQEVLNPAGVNCIRFFSREGVVLWGARTVAPSASNWRYLNVRRLFNMVEESVERSTRWVVFEPNDRPLWKSIRRDVGAFLTLLWRQGALMGATAEQAFFVKCDDETNTPEVIDAGQVVTIIGLAPVKPAEFVIFRIGQSAAGAAIEAV